MQIRSSSCSLVFRAEKPCVRHMAITNKQIMGFLKSGIKWWNSNKMEGRKGEKNVLGGWNLGAGGCRGDVIGPEQEASEKQVSLFILILFAVLARGGEGRGGGAGSQPRQGLLGNGRGCQAGPTANIRSSHLCSQKPGVLPKASFQLHGMITLDVGQLLRATLPLSLYL